MQSYVEPGPLDYYVASITPPAFYGIQEDEFYNFTVTVGAEQ
jgi:hypothetical protein